MSDVLYRYYEEELRFIRELAKEFAKQYPATATRLMLEQDRMPTRTWNGSSRRSRCWPDASG